MVKQSQPEGINHVVLFCNVYVCEGREKRSVTWILALSLIFKNYKTTKKCEWGLGSHLTPVEGTLCCG